MPTEHAATQTPEKQSLPYNFNMGTRSAIVSKKQFGKAWPLTVRSGIVNCPPGPGGNVIAIFQPASSTADHPVRYALNGIAKGSVATQEFDLKPIDPIWADDPAFPGAKKDISVLIDVCKPVM